jgi:hypothetical protein
MNRVPLLTLLSAGLALVVLARQDAQTPAPVADLVARVASLEEQLKTVRALVNFQLNQQLDDTRWNTRESRQLLLQGMLNQKEFQLEHLFQQRLERELQFAETTTNQALGLAELELLAAQRRVVQAEYQLESSEQVAGRVYRNDKQLEFDRNAVETARQRLEAAQAKLAELRAKM